MVLPVSAPVSWDSASVRLEKTERCCASSCARLPQAASATVRSLVPAARSRSNSGLIAVARRQLLALTLQRALRHLLHSSSLECHVLPNLSSPFVSTPVFTGLPHGKQW